MRNTKNYTLLIGSNNAYSWYGLLDEAGALIDFGAESDYNCGFASMQHQIANHDLADWQSMWCDNDQAPMFTDWSIDRDGILIIPQGKAALLDVCGGAVYHRITDQASFDSWRRHLNYSVRLIQEPYLCGDMYTASGYLSVERASEESGPTVTVCWEITGGDPKDNDESNACDWDCPASVEHYAIGDITDTASVQS
jgi:hypothetical protein